MAKSEYEELMKVTGEIKALQAFEAMVAAYQGCNIRTLRAHNIDFASLPLPGNELKQQQAIHMADQLEADIRAGKSLAEAAEALIASGQLSRYEGLEG
jgi:hypothetical protein